MNINSKEILNDFSNILNKLQDNNRLNNYFILSHQKDIDKVLHEIESSEKFNESLFMDCIIKLWESDDEKKLELILDYLQRITDNIEVLKKFKLYPYYRHIKSIRVKIEKSLLDIIQNKNVEEVDMYSVGLYVMQYKLFIVSNLYNKIFQEKQTRKAKETRKELKKGLVRNVNDKQDDESISVYNSLITSKILNEVSFSESEVSKQIEISQAMDNQLKSDMSINFKDVNKEFCSTILKCVTYKSEISEINKFSIIYPLFMCIDKITMPSTNPKFKPYIEIGSKDYKRERRSMVRNFLGYTVK